MITNKRKNTCFYKVTHFPMQFSAIVNRFIVKTYLKVVADSPAYVQKCFIF